MSKIGVTGEQCGGFVFKNLVEVCADNSGLLWHAVFSTKSVAILGALFELLMPRFSER